MSLRSSAAAIFALMMMAPPALSATPVGDDKTRTSIFDFDVAGGEYQSDEQPIDCTINTVRGVFAMTQYRWHAKWHPGIIIRLTKGSGASERLVVLSFSAKQYHPPFRVELASALDDTEDLGSVTFSAAVGQNGASSFFLHWNGDGEVTAAVGGERHSFSLGGRPDMLQIHGSGGVGSVNYELSHTTDLEGDKDCKPIS
jgi:hypothetical protein